MCVDKTVIKETKNILIGTLTGSAFIGLGFLVFGKFDYTVVLGLLLGSAAATLNFFMLGLSVQKSLGKGVKTKLILRQSYTLRMLMYCVVAVLGFKLSCFNALATIIPFFLPRLVIFVMQLTGKYSAKEFNKEVDEMNDAGKENE